MERPGSEAVLTLRAVISNGDFSAYGTYHAQKERKRLYPPPDRHKREPEG